MTRFGNGGRRAFAAAAFARGGTRRALGAAAFAHGARRFSAAAALALFGALGSGLADPGGLAAQSRGFLFGAPRASITVKGGVSFPRAAGASDPQSLWDFTRQQLTVETSDFAGGMFIGELAVRVGERFDVTVAAGFSSSSARSEFRDWEDTEGLPIEQTTKFTTTPITLGVKAFLRQRGRSVGSLAWIPRTFNPYLGAAGGFVSYRFEQYGDFVDFETRDIFTDNLLSAGRAPTVHFLGGVEIGLNRHVMVVAEARYGFASAELDRDFVNFADLDLAGLQAVGGLSLRF